MARKGVDYRAGLASPSDGVDYRQVVAEAQGRFGVDWRSALADLYGKSGVDMRQALAEAAGRFGVDWRSAVADGLGTIVTADGDASGLGAASAVGRANFSGLGSASGLGAATSIGLSIALSPGAAAGIGAASGVGTFDSVTYWTPPTLGSVLRAWYQMDLLTGSNTDPISTINDSSGNSFTLTQVLGLRGTLAAADLNSQNTMRLTAASNQRYPLDATILTGASAGSAYLIQKVVSAAVAQGSPEWGASASQTYSPFSDGKIYDDFGSTVRKTVGTPTGALTSYRIISIYSAANDWACFVDGGTGGSSGGTAALFSTATNTVAWAAAGVNLGANASLTVFDGWYAEVAYTNAKQSTGDRQKMEGYLAHKWGLTGNLDSSHPYKSTKPTV